MLFKWENQLFQNFGCYGTALAIQEKHICEIESGCYYRQIRDAEGCVELMAE